MLFEFWVTTATLIKFAQNSDANSSVQEILTYNQNDGERQFFV